MARLISEKFREWETECEKRFEKTKKNEEELNRIFIEIYGLQNEMTPDVEDKYITIRKANRKREVQSLISYAVGCMFGRFSLDVEGLAYAGGEWNRNVYKTFLPVEDNILVIGGDNVFENDITLLLVDFIRTVYGSETLEENLDFIASALNEDEKTKTARVLIREYFLKEFYKNHCQIYHKRPIYWLFDSGKQDGFKALIYMHRYQKELLGMIQKKYVSPLLEHYEREFLELKSKGLSPQQQINKLEKKIGEMKEYWEKFQNYAKQKIEMDFDNGVTQNYKLFSDLLSPIK